MLKKMVSIPGYGDIDGDGPIVILGPNGSGKTRLAQKLAAGNDVDAISAQRRTWVGESLPVQSEENLQGNIYNQLNRWQQNSWQPTEEIDFILSTLVQDHLERLSTKNDQALASGLQAFEPIADTNLIRILDLWNRLFPKRKLEMRGFFPKVARLDIQDSSPYQLREMSDGEKTVLYMAARVITSKLPVILVDEPELHMHSLLAVKFWDEAEKLRPELRFVFITHDLNFALSRRRATILVVRSDDVVKISLSSDVATSIATDILGVATLPFYAKRIFLFEGEAGQGFASELFSAWFDDESTFAIPAGNRDSVFAAVSGLRAVRVVAADIIGLVDRDFYSDEVLKAVTNGVTVLSLHEIESVLCDQNMVAAIAQHMGKNPTDVWNEFLARVRKEFQGKVLNNVIACRVRARIGDLLDGAFSNAQIDADLTTTSENHKQALTVLDFSTHTATFFQVESKRVQDAINGGGTEMLEILPGKHLLGILSNVLGMNRSTLTGLLLGSLDQKQFKQGDPMFALGADVEKALAAYLPQRRS